MEELKLTFFGVRGSYPVSNKKVIKYGGNTSSILLEKGDKILVLDAGTGFIDVGNYLKKKRGDVKKIDLFLSHLHTDHIQGLPFFDPVFDEEYEINIYSPKDGNLSYKKTIFSLFNHPYSPISNKGIKANINFIELSLKNRKSILIDKEMSVDYIKDNSHPLFGVLIYRLNFKDMSFVYATDIESPNGFNGKILDFIKGADILIHDSQYFDSDYNCKKNSKKGFGHSTVSMAVENAKRGKVGRLFLFHYNPEYSDNEVERMLKKARIKFRDTYLSKELKRIYLRR